VNFAHFAAVKVVPQRIYSICCLHSPDQIIVATGDKSGHIGFLVVKEDQKIDDEEGTPVSLLL